MKVDRYKVNTPAIRELIDALTEADGTASYDTKRERLIAAHTLLAVAIVEVTLEAHGVEE